jgi:HAD superfamily hydrolase (TIGR01509 family)
VVGVCAPRPMSPNLDVVAARWQRALDSAQRAAHLATAPPIRAHPAHSDRSYAEERVEVAQALGRLSRIESVRPSPWLLRVPVTPRMLGLAPATRACLFDLDGVLTDSAVVHALAWAEVFDPLLLRLADETGWPFIPFDRQQDYPTWLDGKPRLEGIHAFLAGRGIRLPEGRPEDPASADTAQGLAKRKGEVLERMMQRRGISALSGARRYLEAAAHAGLPRAVVSASTTTLPMLRLAGLSNLIDVRVDAEVVRTQHLRSRPAPDMLVKACAELGVPPNATVTFTHMPAGVAAGQAAGLAVIGVAVQADSQALSGFGAERVVGGLDALLDPRLRTANGARPTV